MEEILSDYFGSTEYRELSIGERIQQGDVFVQSDKVYQASDIGNGRYSVDHFPHYRVVDQ